MIEVKFKLLRPEALAPKQSPTGGARCYLHACVLTDDKRPSKKIIAPHTTLSIPTGIGLEVPEGHYGMIYSYEVFAETSLFVSGAPYMLQPESRGELVIPLHNSGYEYATIHHESPIAQLVFLPAVFVKLVETKDLAK